MAPVERVVLAASERFPNSRFPALIYRGAYTGSQSELASTFERVFSEHDWPSAWRNGLYTLHHYHSTAHEVLGVYAGWVKATLGGPGGEVVRLEAGDVVVIPAGVAHKNEAQSSDFRTVGAYPSGSEVDMIYGKPGERPAADSRTQAVPFPKEDPVYGLVGPLLEAWRAAR